MCNNNSKPNNCKPITIDIHRQFGQPCVAGTGVTTRAIRDHFLAGNTPYHVELDFGLGKNQVEDALRFELSTLAGKRKMAEMVDPGPVEAHGKWWQLDMKTLRWKEVEKL